MKIKANLIRSKLLVFADVEIKSILKRKNVINNNKKELLSDFKDFTIQFEEKFASSNHNVCTISKEDNCDPIEVIHYITNRSRKKSIKLLYSICSLLKPISTFI